MKKFVIIILILTVIVGIIGFIYFQRNIYSKEILKLEIISQEKVELLEEVKYTVKYKNNGNVRLEDPELVFNYPLNSLPEEGGSLRIVKKAEDLGGIIYPGEEKTFIFIARLVGQEGETMEANATLSYRPRNLKARYTSETSFTTVIERVPLNFDIDLSSRIESGKNLSFRLNYFSNIDYPLSNLRVMIDYPSGFEFISSSPSSLEKTEWDVGLLNRSEGGRIEISGRIMGEVAAEKIFRARIGVWIDGRFILLKEATRGIVIAKPAIYITQQINNNPKYIANPGDLLHYEIFFKNLGEESLTDMFLVVNLIGQPFDLQTVNVPEGDFTPGDNSIIWEWRRLSDLKFLPPQTEGKVEFWVKLKNDWEIKSITDSSPEIRSRIFLSQSREEFSNKVNSRLTISQKGYFQDGIFGNSGPIPPEVGKTTTYTITWQVKNYYNEIKDAKVKAFLPHNVNLTGKISPSEEIDRITFDSQSRELVWNIGDLTVGQGFLNEAPNISFQVSFIPGQNQIGDIAELIGQARIAGQDKWTDQTVQSTASFINTNLPDDSTVNDEMGVVK